MSKNSNKRAMFVRVKLPNDQYTFLDVTRNIGGALPFEKPIATCAMEVSNPVVAFSLIHLNRHSTEIMRSRDLAFPSGAVARLVRKGRQHKNLDESTIIAVVEDAEPFEIPIERKDGGTVAITESGPTFTLTRRPSRVDLFLRSPGTGRILSVGFGGHFGSADSVESTGRAVGKVLRSLSSLGAWKALSAISAVEMPNPIEQKVQGKVVTPDNLSRSVPVALYSDDGSQQMADGQVLVELDMVNADPSTQRLLFHLRPDDALAESWNTEYEEVVRAALDRRFAHNLGAELETMVYGVVLGELTDDQVRTLNQSLHTLPALDVTPAQWRARPVTAGQDS